MNSLLCLLAAVCTQDASVDLRLKLQKDVKLAYRYTFQMERLIPDAPRTEMELTYELVPGAGGDRGTPVAVTLVSAALRMKTKDGAREWDSRKGGESFDGWHSGALEQLIGKAITLLVDSRGRIVESDCKKVVGGLAAASEGEQKEYLQKLAANESLQGINPFTRSLGVVLPERPAASGARWDVPPSMIDPFGGCHLTGVKEGEARLLLWLYHRPEGEEAETVAYERIVGSGAALFSVDKGLLLAMTRRYEPRSTPGSLSLHLRITCALALLDAEGRPQRTPPIPTDGERLGLEEEGNLRRCARNLKELWERQQTWAKQFGGPTKSVPAETGRSFWLALAKSEPPLLDIGTPDQDRLACTADRGDDLRTYRGPKADINGAPAVRAVGSCPPGLHKDGSMVVLRKSGEIIRLGSNDTHAIEAVLQQTLSGEPPKKK